MNAPDELIREAIWQATLDLAQANWEMNECGLEVELLIEVDS